MYFLDSEIVLACPDPGPEPGRPQHGLNQSAGSGGGQLVGSDRQLVSAIGPPVAGTVKNGYQLHSGLYLGNSLPGPAKNRVFIPSIASGHESAGGLFVSSIQ